MVTLHIKSMLPGMVLALSRNETPDARTSTIQRIRKYS